MKEFCDVRKAVKNPLYADPDAYVCYRCFFGDSDASYPCDKCKDNFKYKWDGETAVKRGESKTCK